MLDVSIRLDVLNLLLRLKDGERLALLFITHDIASARYFAEDALVMYAGQMVEGGPGDEQRFPKRTESGNGRWMNCFLYGDGDSSVEENTSRGNN